MTSDASPLPQAARPAALPEAAKPAPLPEAAKPALLQVRDLVHEFHTRAGTVHAVSGVSFDVWPGETLGIVGETGSGKSTLARSILQAPRPTAGAVVFRGTDLVTLRGARLLQARRHLQMVFQDPFGSLDPKWRVRDLVAEPLIAYKTGDRNARRQRVGELLEMVGLAQHGGRRPRELSGGQAQRVAIARALALSPALIICDEAVSSLDVLIQAQVLNLFERLRAELGLSYLFIAHDLALVKQVSDRVAVMYLGKLCEVGPGEAVYRQPLHPYTRALLDSVPGSAQAEATATSPRHDPRRAAVAGPSAERMPVPHPVPAGRAALRGRRAWPARAGHRALGRLPLPAGADGTHPGPFGRKNRRDPAMRMRVLLEPHHGASYDQILALARTTEEAGFDAFFRSDHYLGIDPDDTGYRPTDSWTTLAGLAVQTERVRLGTLMTASTYRQPGPLAITVATVDAMSGGRAELGIGAAWYEREHRFFGIPFPPLGERFDRLGEQLEIITGLWRTAPGEVFSYHGKHYQLEECASIPRPAPARRPSSSAAPGRGARRPWRRGSPTSSTAGCRTGWPSGSPTSGGSAGRPGVIRGRFGCPPRCRCAAAKPAARPPAAPPPWARPGPGCCGWASPAPPATWPAGWPSCGRPARTPSTSTCTTWRTWTTSGCSAARSCPGWTDFRAERPGDQPARHDPGRRVASVAPAVTTASSPTARPRAAVALDVQDEQRTGPGRRGPGLRWAAATGRPDGVRIAVWRRYRPDHSAGNAAGKRGP